MIETVKELQTKEQILLFGWIATMLCLFASLFTNQQLVYTLTLGVLCIVFQFATLLTIGFREKREKMLEKDC